MTLSYAGFYIVPMQSEHKVMVQNDYIFSLDSTEDCMNTTVIFVFLDQSKRNIKIHVQQVYTKESQCSDSRAVKCSISCNVENEIYSHTGYLTSHKLIMTDIANETDNENITILTENEKISTAKAGDNQNFQLCLENVVELRKNRTCNVTCRIDENMAPDCVTGTVTFWMFVIFMCLGTIGFNVTNCATDATCFDILGTDSLILIKG